MFERANGLALLSKPAAPGNDRVKSRNIHRQAMELYCRCVCRDPANLVYASKMLSHLSAQHLSARRLYRRWLAAPGILLRSYRIRKARRRQDWPRFLEHGVKALRSDPWRRSVLLEMAFGCCSQEAAGAALLFLGQALVKHENDLPVLRLQAETLASVGRFEEAATAWAAVLRLGPHDAQARAMHEAIRRPDANLEQANHIGQLTTAFESDPADVSHALGLVDALIEQHAFDRAEAVLQRARGAAGYDGRVEQKTGDLAIARLRRHLVVARQYSAVANTDAAFKLLEQIGRELLLHEAAVYRQRCEKRPHDAESRLALAKRLRDLGDFSAAAEQFALARHSPPHAEEAALEEGECRQRLQQFEAALACYRGAVSTGGNNQNEIQRRANARLEVLENALAQKSASGPSGRVAE